MEKFYQDHSKEFTILFVASQAAGCLLMYILIILLFLSPKSFSVDSLVHPSGSPSPSTVVTICATVLAILTGSLVTECVEHYFWLKITQPNLDDKDRLTVEEVRALARWTVSPIRKVIYFFTGALYYFKPVGILLLAARFVATVLVSGITVTQPLGSTNISYPATAGLYSGWMDDSNSSQNGSNPYPWDTPGFVAATISLSSVSAPSVNTTCPTDYTGLSNKDCTAFASVGAIQATCTGRVFDDSAKPVGCLCNNTPPTYTIFHGNIESIFNLTDEGANLTTGTNYVFADFRTAYISDVFVQNSSGVFSEPGTGPGDFTVILGAWSAYHRAAEKKKVPIKSVGCRLEFGTKNVSQSNDGVPEIVPGSFVKSTSLLNESGLSDLAQIYGSNNSPWSFSGQLYEGENTIYQYPLGFLLLGEDASRDGTTVARLIEEAFDMATLMAWVSSPGSAKTTTVTTDYTLIYTYNPWILLVLIIPFLATVLGTYGKLRFGGYDVVLGYDPLAIASRGPTYSPDGPLGALSEEDQKKSAKTSTDVDGVPRWCIFESDRTSQPVMVQSGPNKNQ